MSKRRNRGFSMKARITTAAAVVVAGGAAAAVVVAGHGGGTTAATSAGFDTKSMSVTQAMSSAMNGWNKNPNQSIVTISKQQPMNSFYQTSWHQKTLAEQRGTVVAAVGKELAVESANKKVELWHWNGNTHVVNVAGNKTATTDVTGSASNWLSSWHMKKSSKLAKGDLVFIFGEKVHGELEAQLVLFAAPTTTTTATPTATATSTATSTTTATATPTATTSTTATATATPTTTSTANSGTTNVNGQNIVVGGNGHD
jgi:hypothetical protein